MGVPGYPGACDWGKILPLACELWEELLSIWVVMLIPGHPASTVREKEFRRDGWVLCGSRSLGSFISSPAWTPEVYGPTS